MFDFSHQLYATSADKTDSLQKTGPVIIKNETARQKTVVIYRIRGTRNNSGNQAFGRLEDKENNATLRRR